MTVHGKNARVYLNASDLSAYLQEVTPERDWDQSDTTTFGAGSKTIYASLGDGKIACKGLFDGGAAAFDAIVTPMVGLSDVVFAVAPAGYAPGSSAFIGQCQLDDYEISSPVADMVQASLSLQLDGGADNGLVYTSSAVANAGLTSPVVDNGAASSNGAVLVFISPPTAGSNATYAATFQHSADNTTWVTIPAVTTPTAGVNQGGFVGGTGGQSNGTAPTAAVAYLPAGTTLNRYTRVVLTNNTNFAQFMFTALARR